MSDIELVIKQSKRFESMLEKHFGATGRGLHEKVGSVERKLPDHLVRRLRFIATIRNKIVHDDGHDHIDDRRGFVDACAAAEADLRKLAGIRGISWKLRLQLAGVAALLIAAIYIYFKFIR
jgi:hypothetical protein